MGNREGPTLPQLKIWHLTRIGIVDYDEFDALVVIADSHDDALKLAAEPLWPEQSKRYGWTTPGFIRVEPIGMADANEDRRVVLASIKAG